jgi:hypothetical protein
LHTIPPYNSNWEYKLLHRSIRGYIDIPETYKSSINNIWDININYFIDNHKKTSTANVVENL